MRFLLFGGFYFGKIWNVLKNGRFSGRIRPDWGNTARADMAELGSIGLYLSVQRKTSNTHSLSLSEIL